MANGSVIVIGGGLSGLVAGLVAAREGASVDLYEGVSQLGGRARTRREDGFHFNMGPHALYRGAAGMEVLGELGVRPDGQVPAISGSLAADGGRLFALPVGALSMLTTGLLGAADKLDMARLLARLGRIDPEPYQRMSVDEGLGRLVSSERVRAVVRGLVRLTSYAHAPDRVSAGAAIHQLKLSLGGVLYLHEGWQSLVDALADAARERGVRIHAGERVRAVTEAGGRVRVDRGGDRDASADGCVLAVPPREAARLTQGAASEALQRAAESAVPARVASLDVGLSRLPDRRRLFALGIDEPFYVSVHSATARLAPEGAAMIHASMYLAPDEAPDREKLERRLSEWLDLLQPGWRDLVVRRHFASDLMVVPRLPLAESGGLAGRPGVAVPGSGRLFLAGDGVGDEGQLADAALASGREAGRRAAGQARRRREAA